MIGVLDLEFHWRVCILDGDSECHEIARDDFNTVLLVLDYDSVAVVGRYQSV